MIVRILTKKYKRDKHNDDPFKVLVHCILSQRTRDEQSYKAVEELFKRFSTPEELASADLETIMELIKNTGLYKAKSRYIVQVAKIIVEKHKGKVPRSMEELLKLPGIGRKCANIVLAYGYGIPAIAVDTHVYRIAKRLGLAPLEATPLQVEKTLMENLPRELWIYVNHAFVDFGRDICKPIKPECNKCLLRESCAYYSKMGKE